VAKVLSLIDGLSRCIGKAVSISIYFVTAAIVYEVIMRVFFSKPTIWAAEGTVFACGLLYLLGGAWTLLDDSHVRVDVFYAKRSARQKAVLDAFTYFFFALYIVVMIWATGKYAFESASLGETTMSPWDPPIWPMKIAMLLALILLFLQGTARFIRNIRLIATSR
jgi:TRAP-type mannitol/chloroaromatic compound transport system permease small subunit